MQLCSYQERDVLPLLSKAGISKRKHIVVQLKFQDKPLHICITATSTYSPL